MVCEDAWRDCQAEDVLLLPLLDKTWFGEAIAMVALGSHGNSVTGWGFGWPGHH